MGLGTVSLKVPPGPIIGVEYVNGLLPAQAVCYWGSKSSPVPLAYKPNNVSDLLIFAIICDRAGNELDWIEL